MTPDVSVIVPCYNGEAYIKTCMECLNKQTYDNFEAIIVDDGSTDASPELIDQYAREDPRIRVIHQENTGLSGARNAGILQARGEYVYFYDVDDEIKPDLVEDNIKLARKYDADLVIFSFYMNLIDQDRILPKTNEELFVGSAVDYFHGQLLKNMDKEMFNAPWNKLIRRSILLENNAFFDTRYPIYEDIIFATKILPFMHRIVVNPEMYYIYILKDSGSLLTKFFEGYFASVTQFYENAMAYCSQFSDNREEVAGFNTLYISLVYSHIKQISLKGDMDREKKEELLMNICQKDCFVEALKNTDLSSPKKKEVRKLILGKKVSSLILLYQTMGLLKK